MDMRLFRPDGNPRRRYKNFDRFNSWTGPRSCRFLEWTGWYSSSLSLRLLGHFRLFQLYKRYHSNRSDGIPLIHGYILQCRAFQGLKHRLAIMGSWVIGIWGYPDPDFQMSALNKILLYERASVLYDFLAGAERDFEKAFQEAIRQMRDPEFLAIGGEKETVVREVVTIKESPVSKAGMGKEKDVFSKKQQLIFFDLLCQAARIERIELHKPGKYAAYARLLQALTGKGKETWLDTLKDYKTKDLYEYHTAGELGELINTLTNLAERFREAGFHSVAELADKKMRELELVRRSSA